MSEEYHKAKDSDEANKREFKACLHDFGYGAGTYKERACCKD